MKSKRRRAPYVSDARCLARALLSSGAGDAFARAFWHRAGIEDLAYLAVDYKQEQVDA